MKKCLFLPLALCTVAVANAAPPPAKIVSLPFHNEEIVTKDHTGLYFDYDMGTNQKRKIVCDYQNVYKSWTTFRNNGQPAEAGVYGNSGYFILTSKGEDDEDTNQWRADSQGSAKIMSYIHKDYPHQTVSCHYEFDDNTIRNS